MGTRQLFPCSNLNSMRKRTNNLFKAAWRGIRCAALLFIEFLFTLLSEIINFKFRHVACIVPAFARLYHPDSWNAICPAFAEFHYTYYSLWYYTLSRLLELFVYYTISVEIKSFTFLIIAIACIGKIIDEGVCPFHFYIGEYLYWVVTVAIVFNVWYIKRRQME